MSESIHKSHNVSNLMYHLVLPTKYSPRICFELDKKCDYGVYFTNR